jgi:membrane associated rhomboid family serine protease
MPLTEDCIVSWVGEASPAPAPPARIGAFPVATPVPASFEERLKKATPWTPVTWALVVGNVLVFAAMALHQRNLTDFSTHDLLSMGAAYAPRTFTGQWWRTVTAMFLHSNLAHLAGNLFFLLLIGPLVERLLGPVRFAGVYLFAGIGGTLLGMGWFPASVAVGASAAVYGVYGAGLGCCLRGPRTISWPFVARRFGCVFLYAAVSLLIGCSMWRKTGSLMWAASCSAWRAASCSGTCCNRPSYGETSCNLPSGRSYLPWSWERRAGGCSDAPPGRSLC